MEKVKTVGTTITADDLQAEEPKKVVATKVVTPTKLIGTRKYESSGKLRVDLLLFDNEDEVTHQVDVSNYCGKQTIKQGKDSDGKDKLRQEVKEPIITAWLDPDKLPFDITSLRFGADVWTVMSVSGSFKRVESILSSEQLKLYKQLLNIA